MTVREAVLNHLRSVSSPVSGPSIASALYANRNTVRRIVGELESAGVITNDGFSGASPLFRLTDPVQMRSSDSASL